MIKVIGVRFRQAGKIYNFDPGRVGNKKRRPCYSGNGKRHRVWLMLFFGVKEEKEEDVVMPLKTVIRVATPEDDQKAQENIEKGKKAFKICKEKIAKHGLEMKLIDSEYTFDNNKVLFYFTADGRIDFRELVKDLASVFKTRIELRQVGVRDEAKMLGGIGMCGRPLCCNTYLSEFIPVSIKQC